MKLETDSLVDGLEGEDRQARQRLLERLADQGFTQEQLQAAVAEERLVLLPVERILRGSLTAEDIEQETGVSTDLLLRIRRASGLPQADSDAQVFGPEDVEAARAVSRFLDAGFSERAVIEITRLLGEAMARVVTAVTASFVETFLRAGDGEDELAERFASATEELTPEFQPVFSAVFKAHLLEAVERGMLGATERESGQVDAGQPMAVCFVDVVGFTRLGSEVELDQLGDVATRLAEMAAEVAEAPVRLVKTIGDAAMLVSGEAGALVAAALALLQNFEEAELPTLRAGIAWGPAVVRAGDYFGHSVNLASRVTAIARPASVLCTEEIHDQAGETFDWSAAGKHRFKGVKGSMALYRARPRTSES